MTNPSNSKEFPCIILIRPKIKDMIYEMPNPPIGLGYLASFVQKYNYKAYILDLAIQNITNETLIKLINKKKPLLIGISALTAYYTSLIDLSNKIKQKINDIPIVLGGVHPSTLPELSLRESGADFVVLGEGEQTLLELTQALDKNHSAKLEDVNGLGFLKNDEYIQTPPRELISNLDDIPFPAWHKINPLKYPKEPHGFILKYAKVAPIISTRGCPYNCTYCASCNFWGQKIRFRSPRNVVDEIEYLINKFGIREIHFWDDNLTMKPSHIIGICKEIINRGLKIACATPNGIRVDSLSKNILKWMKAAGFYYLLFAVESGSTKVLKSANKKTDLKIIARNAFLAKKIGFNLQSYFILGFPTDTEETMEKTIKMAKSLPFDFWGFFIMKPLPGSEIFKNWAKNKDLKGFEWSSLNYHSFKNAISPLDEKILRKYFNRAFRAVIMTKFFHTFYFRYIAYGNLAQLKYFIVRIIFFILGYNESTINIEASIR